MIILYLGYASSLHGSIKLYSHAIFIMNDDNTLISHSFKLVISLIVVQAWLSGYFFLKKKATLGIGVCHAWHKHSWVFFQYFVFFWLKYLFDMYALKGIGSLSHWLGWKYFGFVYTDRPIPIFCPVLGLLISQIFSQ